MKPRCPSCSADQLLKHCDSPTCNWVRCTQCLSYGVLGGLWCDMRKRKAS